jgi:formylmethanofuran dehydrogenase subunit E
MTSQNDRRRIDTQTMSWRNERSLLVSQKFNKLTKLQEEQKHQNGRNVVLNKIIKRQVHGCVRCGKCGSYVIGVDGRSREKR